MTLLKKPAQDWLVLKAEVEEALKAGRPVVALESTLIAHGLPFPTNLETAHRLEEVIRAEGATPATIAVLGGRLRIGLDNAGLERLARGGNIRKVSRRDLPIVVAQGGDGATTVAATMWIAAQAGIKVFATGGIGGVHRGQPFDVSADLPELARTPVAVVCAGAKSILDLPLTLEWLETWGVPVLGYGTDEFPAFYTRSSGLPVDARVDSPQAAAEIIRARWDLGLGGGVLIVAPVPAEAELPAEVMEMAIAQALAAAEEQGIRGKAITPFLLARIAEITGGDSLQANVALLENNAAIAARIAGALAA
ncbi:MAG: pseudouridine-5'-phosphate glycosidase [Anaerolineae bacterium]|jgi:pseudouridine-5'-phosphate glycosidase|nr:pseudouridine-5'-phosphate glycosidase [Anaerolineae bacterium]MDH7475106.1 pseudouridine-5'-phosphate glycosidase [Anaerolineae bacterium]